MCTGRHTKSCDENSEKFLTGKLTSFASADQSCERFKALLERLGVNIVSGGELHQLFSVIHQMADWHNQIGKPPDGVDLRIQFRKMVGLTHLMDLALSLPEEQLTPFAGHFELLNKGSPLQNIPALANDPSSDKVFELLVGLAAVRAGALVSLDDPHHPKGDNPDVIARFANDCWGFACKSVSGDAPATLFERVEDGVRQIEASEVSRGFVTVNFKNR